MCGIVAAVSTRNIVPILVQGLQRLPRLAAPLRKLRLRRPGLQPLTQLPLRQFLRLRSGLRGRICWLMVGSCVVQRGRSQRLQVPRHHQVPRHLQAPRHHLEHMHQAQPLWRSSTAASRSSRRVCQNQS